MDITGSTNKITQFPGSLHNHTQYSNLRLRDCIIKEEDLIHLTEYGKEVCSDAVVKSILKVEKV